MAASYTPLENDAEDAAQASHEAAWLDSRKAGLFRAFLKEFVNKNVIVKSANGWPADAENLHDAMVAHAMEIGAGVPKLAQPAFLFIAGSEALDPKEVLREAKLLFPKTRNIHCTTSCQGVTTDSGFVSNDAAKKASLRRAASRATLSKTLSKSSSQLLQQTSSQSEGGVGHALALLAVFDPLGSYVTFGQPAIDGQNVQAKNVHEAFDRAYMRLRETALDVLRDPNNDALGIPAEEPLSQGLTIWMSGMPGTEEIALETVYDWSQSRFNRTVPVVGGSCADASIGGLWRTYANQSDNTEVIFGQESGQGIVFTMIASSVKVFPLFMHPYTPMTKQTAKVLTAGSGEAYQGEAGGRVVFKVLNENNEEEDAGNLYHRWCETTVQKNLMPAAERASGPGAFNGDVLAASAVSPLGVPVSRTGDDAYDYRMLHPSGIYLPSDEPQNADKAYLKAFASAESNDELVLFKATKGDLLNRLGKFKEQLVSQMDRASGGTDSVASSPDAMHARVAGVLMVYCAGCMMRVSSGKDGAEQMRRLTMTLSTCFAGRPFLAYHPFGEQGFYPSKEVNHHGNLMFAALVFTKDPSLEFDETRNFGEMIMPILRKFSTSGQDNAVFETLLNLIQNGERADFPSIGRIIQAKEVSPALLQGLVMCSGRPVKFALQAAEMFHKLAYVHPLQATMYLKEAQWFKDFLVDFMTDARWTVLEKACLLDEDTLVQSVRLAGTINNGGFVATHAFQELMDLIWKFGLSIGEATQVLSGMEGGSASVSEQATSRVTVSPKMRFLMNTISLVVLAGLQYTTSHYYTNNVYLWLACLTFSASHLCQMLGSSSSGFYTWIHIVDDFFIVGAHCAIVYSVYNNQGVPRDLDAMTMLLHFANVTKNMVVNQSIGPLVITLMTMAGNVGGVCALLVFWSTAFLSSLNAVYRGHEAHAIHSEWSPMTLLVSTLGYGDTMWQVPEDDTQSLFLSLVTGMDDSSSINYAGCVLIALAALTIPILLVNLMIAVMSSSYAEVQDDVDVQSKVQFAGCVMQARSLSVLPMPFSMPYDLFRIVKKFIKNPEGRTQSADQVGEMEETLDEIAWKELGVGQLLTQSEVRTSLRKLKQVANVEQFERMRIQTDTLQDRVQVLYNCLLDTKEIVSSAQSGMPRHRVQ